MGLIVITGTTSGLGKEIARLVFGTRHSALLLSRRFDKEQQDAAAGSAGRIRLIAADFRDFDHEVLAAAARGMLQPDDSVTFISNAGTVEPIGSIGALPSEALKDAASVNYLAPMLITNALLGVLNKGNRLTILNISSGAAARPIAGWAAYCSSKAGALMFFDVIEAEAAAGNIDLTVKHINPGLMNTEMQRRIRQAGEGGFPSQPTFVKYQVDGQLKPPDKVARDILVSEGLLT